jgi:PPM family protein phosphatase
MSEVSARASLTIGFGEVCDRGKVREENQDSVRRATVPLGELFIVADGIGGYQGGATASRMVVEEFHAQLAALPADYPADDALREACVHANAVIYAEALSGDPSLQRMGSTVVVALIQRGLDVEPVAWIGHVGDSRTYLIRNGKMNKVTSDHSAVQALLSRNLITEEEARNHPDASVLTRSLGHHPEVEIELDRVPLLAGDALLLCSDGLWGYVAEGDIAAVVTDGELGTQTIADTLLHQALATGGQDNIGIEFIRIAAGAAVPATTLATTLPDDHHPVAQSLPVKTASVGVQRMVAIALLLLASCGFLAYAAYNHSWSLHHFFKAEQVSKSPAAPAVPATPSRPGDSRSQPAIQSRSADHPAMAPDNGQIARPISAARSQDKSILVVGGIPVGGDEIQLPSKAIQWRHLRLARDSRPACAALSENSPVMYAAPHENIIELVTQHPELAATLLRSPPRPITSAIKRVCGDADVILILPRSVSRSR